MFLKEELFNNLLELNGSNEFCEIIMSMKKIENKDGDIIII